MWGDIKVTFSLLGEGRLGANSGSLSRVNAGGSSSSLSGGHAGLGHPTVLVAEGVDVAASLPS